MRAARGARLDRRLRQDVPEFWLNARPEMAPLPVHHGSHVCLRVRSTELVDAFHTAALANGGTPTVRPGCGRTTAKGYYAAFIRDLTATASRR